jgi:alpha-tubulin suppressor-like RCC1 family protein
VKAISAGSFHSLAVTSTGQVLAWGDNRNGELGDGTTTSSDTPVFVHMPVGVAAVGVAGGNSDSLALTSTGRVLAWGFNGLGELGDGTTTERHHPVAVKLATGTKVRGVFCGEFHVIALTSTGKVLGWGSNQFGSLGDGTSTDRHRPVAVKLPAGTTVTGVSAGFAHSLAVTSGGKVFAWGFNGSGELGNGTHLISDLPVKAKLPAGLVATAVGSGAGAQWSLAIVHPAAP